MKNQSHKDLAEKHWQNIDTRTFFSLIIIHIRILIQIEKWGSNQVEVIGNSWNRDYRGCGNLVHWMNLKHLKNSTILLIFTIGCLMSGQEPLLLRKLFEYIPQLQCLLVKMGKHGAAMVTRDVRTSNEHNLPSRALRIQHCGAPHVPDHAVVSASGGGDWYGLQWNFVFYFFCLFFFSNTFYALPHLNRLLCNVIKKMQFPAIKNTIWQ